MIYPLPRHQPTKVTIVNLKAGHEATHNPEKAKIAEPDGFCFPKND